MLVSDSANKRILFSFWDGGMGHLARIRNLAHEAINRGHRIGFITSEKYVDYLNKLTSPENIFIIPNRPPNVQPPPYDFPIYSHAFRQAQHLCGLGLNNIEWLKQTAYKEISAIQRFHPDVIVNDNRSTLRTAAEVCNVPLVAIAHTTGNLNGYHLGSWVEPPADAVLPDCRASFNAVRKSYNLASIEDELYMYNGEVNIIPSIPDLDPLKYSSPTTHYVGAISKWESESGKFCTIKAPTKHNIFSYVGEPTRPAFGYEAILERLIESEPDFGFYIVGDPDKFNSPEVRIRQNIGSVIISPFIPAATALLDCSVLLTHGGHSTICTALTLGRPAIGVGAFQSEAASTLRYLEQAGAGIYLPHSMAELTEMKAPDLGNDVSIFGHWNTELNVEKVQTALHTVLNDDNYSLRAAELGKKLTECGGAVGALKIIEKTCQPTNIFRN